MQGHPLLEAPAWRSYWWVVLLFALLASFVVASYAAIGRPRIYSEGIFYYAYLRSAFFDGDLDFSNEYALYRPRDHYLNPVDPVLPGPQDKTATGLLPNHQPIGPAIAWSPFFLVGHLTALVARGAGLSLEIDGFSAPYQVAIALGTIFYASFALAVTWKWCTRFSSRSSALTAVLLIFSSTPAIYYSVVEPTMSHMVSAAGVALFLYLWCHLGGTPTFRRWALVGVAGGLMALMRWQNATFLVLPGLIWLEEVLRSVRHHEGRRLPTLIAEGALLLGTALLVFLPQVLVWRAIYGVYLMVHQPVSYPPWTEFLRWGSPRIVEVLFSAQRGLFTWSPILLLATVGLIVLARRHRRLALNLLVMLAIQTYINASVVDWWGGWAFGARRFTDLLPIFSLGLASLLDRLPHRQWAILALFAAFPAWNFLSILQFLFFNPTGAFFFSWYEMTWGKVEMIVFIMRRLGMGF